MKDWKYNKTQIAYIKRNVGKKTYDEMSKHLGIAPNTIRMKVTRLRQKGVHIPDARIAEIGEVKTRVYKSRNPRQFKKIAANKWIEVTPKKIREPKPKVKRERVRKVKTRERIFERVVTKKATPSNGGNHTSFIASLTPKQMIVNPKTEGKILVKIDNRTWVYKTA